MDAAGLSDAAMQASIRALVAPADAIFLDAKVGGGRKALPARRSSVCGPGADDSRSLRGMMATVVIRVYDSPYEL